MRNTTRRSKFSIASRIEETDKIIKSVERKLAPNLIDKCKIDWANSFTSCGGLTITGYFFESSECNKRFTIHIRAEYNEVSVIIETAVCNKLMDYKTDTTRESYEVFRAEYPKNDGNNAYDKAVKKRKQDAVKYIISKIEFYYGDNATKFILK